ncbi:MAG: gliding motility-associated-like protein [Flavobacteriales bacterium]|jgi:gliding motility-associated-like protein
MLSPLSRITLRLGLLCFASLIFTSVVAQPSNDNCSNALEVCANQTFSMSNVGANASVCSNCEDDFNFCFDTQNSIWMSFTTNAAGGIVQVDFSNLVFSAIAGQDNELQATIIQAGTPCDGSTYIQLGNCVSNAVGNFSLIAPGLAPLTQYYIVVDGDDNGVGITIAAECSFDIVLSGAGIDRLPSSIFISPASGTYCLNEIVTFSAGLIDCPDNGNYEWFINGVLAATTSIPTFQTTALLDGDIVSVQTSCYLICPEVVLTVGLANTIISFPIDAGPDQTIVPGEFAPLNGSTSAPVYTWTPAETISDTGSLTPFAMPTVTTTYTLTGTYLGCILSDQVTITIASELFIPTTFSPNADNINETWLIEGMEDYPNALVRVFTRWGQQVFESNGYSAVKAWKGTSKRGGNLASGVYYYVIELNDEEEQLFKGSVTLIR